jgi:hypothetical protein
MKFYYITLILLLITFSCKKENVTRIPYVEIEIPENLKGVWKSENGNGEIEYFRLEKNGIKNGELININEEGKLSLHFFTFYVERNQMRWNEIWYGTKNYKLRNDTLIIEIAYKTYKYYTKSSHEEFDQHLKPVKIKRIIELPPSITRPRNSIVIKDNFLYYVSSNAYLYKYDLTTNKFKDSFYVNSDRTGIAMKNNNIFYCSPGTDYLWKIKSDFSESTVACNDLIEYYGSFTFDPNNQYFFFTSEYNVTRTLENGDLEEFANDIKRGFENAFYYKNDEFIATSYLYGTSFVSYQNILQKFQFKDELEYGESYVFGNNDQEVYHISCIEGELWLSVYNSKTDKYELINIEL